MLFFFISDSIASLFDDVSDTLDMVDCPLVAKRGGGGCSRLRKLGTKATRTGKAGKRKSSRFLLVCNIRKKKVCGHLPAKLKIK